MLLKNWQFEGFSLNGFNVKDRYKKPNNIFDIKLIWLKINKYSKA
jgi:hypothetical protein